MTKDYDEADGRMLLCDYKDPMKATENLLTALRYAHNRLDGVEFTGYMGKPLEMKYTPTNLESHKKIMKMVDWYFEEYNTKEVQDIMKQKVACVLRFDRDKDVDAIISTTAEIISEYPMDMVNHMVRTVIKNCQYFPQPKGWTQSILQDTNIYALRCVVRDRVAFVDPFRKTGETWLAKLSQ